MIILDSTLLHFISDYLDVFNSLYPFQCSQHAFTAAETMGRRWSKSCKPLEKKESRRSFAIREALLASSFSSHDAASLLEAAGLEPSGDGVLSPNDVSVDGYASTPKRMGSGSGSGSGSGVGTRHVLSEDDDDEEEEDDEGEEYDDMELNGDLDLPPQFEGDVTQKSLNSKGLRKDGVGRRHTSLGSMSDDVDLGPILEHIEGFLRIQSVFYTKKYSSVSCDVTKFTDPIWQRFFQCY